MRALLSRRFKAWAASNPRVDTWIAYSVAAVALLLSFVDAAWRIRLTQPVLAEGVWRGNIQTIATVYAALLGFGTTAIAITLALSSGSRGQRVFRFAGPELTRVLGACLGSLVFGTALLALLTGVQPSRWPHSVGTLFAGLVTLMSLRLVRLWYFVRRLLDVYVLDQAGEQPVATDHTTT